MHFTLDRNTKKSDSRIFKKIMYRLISEFAKFKWHGLLSSIERKRRNVLVEFVRNHLIYPLRRQLTNLIATEQASLSILSAEEIAHPRARMANFR